MTHTIVQPDSWSRPRGYAHGVVATGRTVYVAGQIGWDRDHRFAGDDLPSQFGQALDNVIAVVEAAGGAPADIVQMTIYVTDMQAYRACAGALAPVWRARFGTHYPAMALVGVADLVVARSCVEIQAVAVIAEPAS